jgi:hypothetical protein
MFIWIGSECSSVEIGSDSERKQRRCAIRSDQAIDQVKVTIDDNTVDIRQPAFEVVSPQRAVELPPGNIFDVVPGPATFVAHAWAAHVTGLRPGSHTLTIDVPAFGEPFSFTIEIRSGRQYDGR